jgi:hypothetical protein
MAAPEATHPQGSQLLTLDISYALPRLTLHWMESDTWEHLNRTQDDQPCSIEGRTYLHPGVRKLTPFGAWSPSLLQPLTLAAGLLMASRERHQNTQATLSKVNP